MPQSYNRLFPWLRVEKGQGFFVPCLDTHVTREAGLKAALKHRCFDARAYPAIRGGVIARSDMDGVDVDYLFCQVNFDKPLVDTTPNCGNILAGVGPFAIERGLVKAQDPVTKVRVRTINTGTLADLVIETPGGKVREGGQARIDGVPGTSAPIAIDFIDAEGSVSHLTAIS